MKKDIKEKWIAALRSNDYKQTRNALKADYLMNFGANNEQEYQGYCCLGVLIDVCSKNGIPVKWFKETSKDYAYTCEYKGKQEDTSLPVNLMEELQIASFLESHLIALNDTELNNFNQIADWIQEIL